MTSSPRGFFRGLVLATALKTLLLPSYFSTDFDVHRTWLAITHSLPLREWYTYSDTIWKLDYPPLFAYFEWAISHLARFFAPELLILGSADVPEKAVWFHRATVVAADLLLAAAIWQRLRRLTPHGVKILGVRETPASRSIVALLLVSLLFSPGLLAVDSVHFQYNGALLGLLLLAIGAVERGRKLTGAALFVALVHAKHIHLSAAPVFLVYLYRKYCAGRGRSHILSLASLSLVVSAISAVILAPFAYHGQMRLLLARLVPTARGLCHTYWAPNAWAVYAAADRGLARWLGVKGPQTPTAEAVAEGAAPGGGCPLRLLPTPTPLVCLILSLLAMAPVILRLWHRPSPRAFCLSVAVANGCAFLFGFHVHEKAVLHFTVPLLASLALPSSLSVSLAMPKVKALSDRHLRVATLDVATPRPMGSPRTPQPPPPQSRKTENVRRSREEDNAALLRWEPSPADAGNEASRLDRVRRRAAPRGAQGATRAAERGGGGDGGSVGRERGEGGGGERRNGGGVAAGRSLRSLGTGAVASVVRRRADWPGAGARGKYVVAKLGGESGGDSAMHGAGGAGDFMLVRVHARGMVMATVIAHYGVMPLLHESREYPIRVAMIVCHSALSFALVNRLETSLCCSLYPPRNTLDSARSLLRRPQDLPRFLCDVLALQCALLPALEIYISFLHPLIWGRSALEFLPLMLVSVFSAFGVAAGVVVAACDVLG